MKMRRIESGGRKFFVPFALVIGLLLTSCGSANTPPAPTLVPPTPVPPTATPLPPPTATPFVPKATLRIASQSPGSTDIAHAAELAVEQLAGPLAELGYKVELVPYDDQADIDVGVANAKEIIADPTIVCGVGHYNSRVMISASDLYHVAGLAFVSPSNTNPKVTDRGYLEVNRLVGRDDGQGAAAAKFAQVQGLTKVFIVKTGDDYATRNANGFKTEAAKLGLKVLGDFKASVEMGNFEAVAKHVMDAGPEVVYFSGSADQAGAFFKQARLAGFTGMLLGIDDNPVLVDTAGPLSIEGSGLYYTGTAAPAASYPGGAQFAKDFELKFGAAPQLYAAEAYDAAGVCLKAIEEAAKAKDGELPTRAEVARAIRALKDYQGITATYNFNKKGDPTLVNYYVFKVVSPDPGNWGTNTLAATIAIESPK